MFFTPLDVYELVVSDVKFRVLQASRSNSGDHRLSGLAPHG